MAKVVTLRRIPGNNDLARGTSGLEAVDHQARQVAVLDRVPPSSPLTNFDNGTARTTGSQEVKHLIVIPVASLNRVALNALAYARSLTDNVAAVHVAPEGEPEHVADLKARWHEQVPSIPLVIVDSPRRSLQRTLLAYIDALHSEHPDASLTVLICEFVSSRPWEYLLHSQSSLRLKAALLRRPGIMVIGMPYHIGKGRDRRGR